jgi:hypothetical protein
MQISRHWRLNAHRYRLEGFRNQHGEVSLQARPMSIEAEDTTQKTPAQLVTEANTSSVAVA